MFETYDTIFNRRGEAYHRAMRLVPGARRREFLLALDHVGVRRGEVLCDVPSGGGYLVEYLRPDLKVRLVAVDPSEVFARTWEDKRVGWHLAPLHQLPIEDTAIDALVSIAGLHHVDDRPAVLQEMRRVLRPGGRLCILEVPVGSITDRFLNGFVDSYNSNGKARAIADHVLVRRHLRVCWENRVPIGNCSRCEKCVRTMIAFAICGRLDDCETFDRTVPIERCVDGLAIVEPHLVSIYEELRCDIDSPELGAAVDRLLARSKAGGQRGIGLINTQAVVD